MTSSKHFLFCTTAFLAMTLASSAYAVGSLEFLGFRCVHVSADKTKIEKLAVFRKEFPLERKNFSFNFTDEKGSTLTGYVFSNEKRITISARLSVESRSAGGETSITREDLQVVAMGSCSDPADIGNLILEATVRP